MGGRAPQHLFPLLYERRSEWVVTKAVGGRLPEHLKAVVMCCRPRRSRAIGVYGTTLSRFCVRGVSRGSECPPPRFGDCSGSGWCEVAHVCADHRGLGGCSCPVWMPVLQFCWCAASAYGPRFTRGPHRWWSRVLPCVRIARERVVAPPPPHVFVRVRGFWCCGRVRK